MLTSDCLVPFWLQSADIGDSNAGDSAFCVFCLLSYAAAAAA